MEQKVKDENKKKQILTLIIGMLIGGIITAGIFLIFKPNNARNIPDFSQFNRDRREFNFDRSERPSRDGNNSKDSKPIEEKTDEKQG